MEKNRIGSWQFFIGFLICFVRKLTSKSCENSTIKCCHFGPVSDNMNTIRLCGRSMQSIMSQSVCWSAFLKSAPA